METDEQDANKDKYKTKMFPPQAIKIPERNPHSYSTKRPFGIDNPYYFYNCNSKGVGKGLWPRFSEPVQSCAPEPKPTAMFKLSVTGSYPSTNSVYREHVMDLYESTLMSTIIFPKSMLRPVKNLSVNYLTSTLLM